MVAGPLDHRRRRQRCVACSSSHLKVSCSASRNLVTLTRCIQCSGEIPCENCVRRQSECKLPARDLTIKLDGDQTHHSGNVGIVTRKGSLNQSPSLDKQTLYIVAFFAAFLPRNSFTGRLLSYNLTVQDHLASQESLSNVVSAIGALHTANLGGSPEAQRVSDALRYYEAAVNALRVEIARVENQELLGLSWSTLLSGVFEVRLSLLIVIFLPALTDICCSSCTMTQDSAG